MWVLGARGDIFNSSSEMMQDPDSCCVSVIGRLKPGVGRSNAHTLSAQFLSDLK